MNDDEVMQWLSEEQRFHFYEQPDDVTRSALRALAETRKALAAHEWAAGEVNHCVTCLGTEHKPDCIFATMPRPRK